MSVSGEDARAADMLPVVWLAEGLTSEQRRARIIAEHRPDEHGVCRGCAEWWGHLVHVAVCAQLMWATDRWMEPVRPRVPPVVYRPVPQRPALVAQDGTYHSGQVSVG